MEFTFEKFKTENIAIRCETQEEYDLFMQLCEKQGLKWCSEECPTDFDCWEEYNGYATIEYKFEFNCLLYSDCSWYEENHYQILEAADIIKQYK